PVPDDDTPPAPLTARPQALSAEVMRTATLVLLAVGSVLFVSPLILFSTGGVFPTAGAIVVSIALGRVWAHHAGRSKNFLMALGVGIASGAIWTNWSRVTNTLFVLAGVILVAIGLRRGDAHRPRQRRRAERAA